jgi:hypothetical protein
VTAAKSLPLLESVMPDGAVTVVAAEGAGRGRLIAA